MSIKVSLEELTKVFSVDFPSRSLNILDGLDYDEQKDFNHMVNTKWTEVDHVPHDAVHLLNHRAFNYFFPCFIYLSQKNLRKYDLHVDSIVSMISVMPDITKSNDLYRHDRFARELYEMSSIADIDDYSWNRDRFDLFTKNQFRVITKWLYWLKGIEWDVDSYAEFEDNKLDRSIEIINKRC